MFTDPDNYNQRDTERDFPTFGESSEIKKKIIIQYIQIIQNLLHLVQKIKI